MRFGFDANVDVKIIFFCKYIVKVKDDQIYLIYSMATSKILLDKILKKKLESIKILINYD